MLLKRLFIIFFILIFTFCLSRGGLTFSQQQREEATYRFNLGLDYAQKSLWGAAIIEFKNALAIDSSFVEAYNNLGAVYFYKERLNDAISVYKEALKIIPNLAEVHYNLGLVYKKMDDLKKAGDYFFKGGLLFLEQGEVTKARRCMKELERIGNAKKARALSERISP